MKGNKTGERERERKKKERARLGSTVTVGWFESMIRCRPQSQLRLPIALIRYIWFSDINHQPSLLYSIYFFFPIIFFSRILMPTLSLENEERCAAALKKIPYTRWSVIVLSEFLCVMRPQHEGHENEKRPGVFCFHLGWRPHTWIYCREQQQTKTRENVILKNETTKYISFPRCWFRSFWVV